MIAWNLIQARPTHRFRDATTARGSTNLVPHISLAGRVAYPSQIDFNRPLTKMMWLPTGLSQWSYKYPPQAMLRPRTQWWVQLHVSPMKSNYWRKSGGVALIKTLPTCWHSFVRRQLEQKENVGHLGHAGKKNWNAKNEEREKGKRKKKTNLGG